jgi:hypothetical protein
VATCEILTRSTDETIAVANTDASQTQFFISVMALTDRHNPLRNRFAGVGRDVRWMTADGDVLLVVAAVDYTLSLKVVLSLSLSLFDTDSIFMSVVVHVSLPRITSGSSSIGGRASSWRPSPA